jgi:hypothetical protein
MDRGWMPRVRDRTIYRIGLCSWPKTLCIEYLDREMLCLTPLFTNSQLSLQLVSAFSPLTYCASVDRGDNKITVDCERYNDLKNKSKTSTFRAKALRREVSSHCSQLFLVSCKEDILASIGGFHQVPVQCTWRAFKQKNLIRLSLFNLQLP